MTLKFNRSGCEAITAAKVQVNEKSEKIGLPRPRGERLNLISDSYSTPQTVPSDPKKPYSLI